MGRKVDAERGSAIAAPVRAVILVILLAVTLSACGGDGGPTSAEGSGSTRDAAAESPIEASPTLAEPSCEPQVERTITAVDLEFDTNCVAASAGEAFTVVLVNAEPPELKDKHNFSVTLRDNTSVFTGEVIPPGNEIANEIGSLEVGDYYFVCDIHPGTMFGDLYIR